MQKHYFLSSLFILCLTACQHAEPPLATGTHQLASQAFQYCLTHASVEAQNFAILSCADQALDAGLDAMSENKLQTIDLKKLSQEERQWLNILQARLAINHQKNNRAAKLIKKINPYKSSKHLRQAWFKIESILSQRYHHWAKALEFALLASEQPFSSHEINTLWRIAQQSYTETPNESVNSKRGQAWIELAKIIGDFDGNVQDFEAKIENWKLHHKKHEANALLAEHMVSPASSPALCIENQNQSPTFDQGLMGAYFKDKTKKKPMIQWISHKKSKETGCTSFITVTPKGTSLKPWAISNPKQQQSWQELQPSLVTEKLKQMGRDHPIILYEKNKKAQAKRLIQAMKSKQIEVVTEFIIQNQNDHTQGISKLLGLEDTKARLESIRQATWTPMRLATNRRQDFDSIIILSSYDEASKLVPLLHFFYADRVPTFLIPSNHLSNQKMVKELHHSWVLDTESSSNDPLMFYGHDSYLLTKYKAILNNYPKLSIAGKTGDLKLYRQNPQRLTYWTQAGPSGLTFIN